jgi:hypothetical protein
MALSQGDRNKGQCRTQGGHENGGHMPAILDFIVIVKKFK